MHKGFLRSMLTQVSRFMNLNCLVALGTLACTASSVAGVSQDVEQVSLQIEKEIAGQRHSADKFSVGFLIPAENFSSATAAESRILVLQDDTGKDLLEEHVAAVAAYQNETEQLAKKGRYRSSSRTNGLIEPEKWQPLQNGSGFLATVSSGMTRPADDASRLHARIEITYRVKGDSNERVNVSIPSLYKDPSVMFEGKRIKLEQRGTATVGDTKYFSFEIPQAPVTASITGVTLLDEQGDPVERDFPIGTGAAEFYVTSNEARKPVNLEISYVSTTDETILVDEWVGIGL